MKSNYMLLGLITVILLITLVMSTKGTEYFNIDYNVTTEEEQIKINVEMINYDLSVIDEPSIGVHVGTISKDFNILIIPSYNYSYVYNTSDINNFYCEIATVSEPDYTFTKTIDVVPGKYLVIVANPGHNFGDGYIYDGLIVGVDNFCPILKNGIVDMTFNEMHDRIYTTLVEKSIDDYIYVTDPPIEIKVPTPTPSPIPTMTSIPTETPSPTPTLVVEPTPIEISTPSPTSQAAPVPTPTPQQSGFEFIISLLSLAVVFFIARRNK